MQTFARATLATITLVLTGSGVLAQEPDLLVGLRGGVTSENSEDGLTGTVPALGATVSIAVTPEWRADFEFWLPKYLDDDFGEPKHRDVLFSLSAMRMFRAGRTRPFLLAGLSFSRTQDWFTFCTAERTIDPGGPLVPTQVSCAEPDVIERRRQRNDGRDGYLLVGGGLEIPIHPRLNFVADLRVSAAPTSLLLRPGIGLVLKF